MNQSNNYIYISHSIVFMFVITLLACEIYNLRLKMPTGSHWRKWEKHVITCGFVGFFREGHLVCFLQGQKQDHLLGQSFFHSYICYVIG